MLDPAPPVAARRADCGGGLGIALQREGTAEHGHRHLPLVEQAEQAPEADAAAIFEHALAGEVAALDALYQSMRLGKPELGKAFPILHGGLRALLIIHDEIDREPRPVRPIG